MDVWKRDDVVRVLTKEEGKVFVNVDKFDRKIAEEVKLVDSSMQNLICDGMIVSDVNRLLYAGSYVVACRLGLMGKKKNNVMKKKP